MRWLGLWGLWLFAQTIQDAERWSDAGPVGSARAMGLAGAVAALGPEPANLTINPGALGMTLKGGIWVTPTLYLPNTKTSYLNKSTLAARTHLSLSNLALLFYIPGGKKIPSWAIGFGYNQDISLSSLTRAKAFNTLNSISQAWAEEAEGVPDTLLTGPPALAYYNYYALYNGSGYDTFGVIDPISINPWRYQGVFSQAGIEQEFEIRQRGRLNTWGISAAINYGDMIYAGASILIRSLRYENTLFFTERDIENRYNGQNNTNAADNFKYAEQYTSQGTGIGLGIGIVAQPVDMMRVGLSFQTPSVILVSESYTSELDFASDEKPDLPQTTALEPSEFEYRFTTPYRVQVGIVFLVGRKGLITADYELVDYRQAQFRATSYSYGALNSLIDKSFTSGSNFRVGMEWRLADAYMIRGGYGYYTSIWNTESRAYYPDPLQPQNLARLPMERQYVSLGGGWRKDAFFLDVAYVLMLSKQKGLPYFMTLSAPPVFISEIRRHAVHISLGFRW